MNGLRVEAVLQTLPCPFWTYIDAGGTVWGCSAYLRTNVLFTATFIKTHSRKFGRVKKGLRLFAGQKKTRYKPMSGKLQDG